MYYYKFIVSYKDNHQQTFFKFCKHYKKTKLYKTCIQLLERDEIESFTVSNN